jgi:hypothetical protein
MAASPNPSTSLPYLNRRLRVYLHELDRLCRQVDGRAGAEGVPGATLSGDAASVRAAAAALIAAEVAAMQGAGLDPAAGDPARALGLMALDGDAAFADLPSWGLGAAPPLAGDWPLPPSGAAGLADQVRTLLDAAAPQPELAELYLLALTAGAARRVEDPDQRAWLEASRTPLAQAAAAARPPADGRDVLFPDAYPAPRRHGPARELPRTALWVAAAPAAAAALLAGSWLVWWLATHPLTRTVCTFVAERLS